MTKLIDKVLHNIKEQHIAPKPRWQFLLHDGMVAGAVVLSVLVGSISFSVLLYHLTNNDWEILELLPQTPLQHFFSTLPYIWLLLLVLFVGLAYYNACHTKRAYRYHAYWILLGSIVTSIVMGGALYTIGLASPIHTYFAERLPVYNKLMPDREHFWTQPEAGLLAGQITRVVPQEVYFELRDFSGEIWIVEMDDINIPVILSEGQYVRVLGAVTGGGGEVHFEAQQILPYQRGPGLRYFHPPHLEMMLEARTF